MHMPDDQPQKLDVEEYKQEVSVYRNLRGKLTQLEKTRESLRPSSLVRFAISFFVAFFVSAVFGKDIWSSVAVSVFFAFYFSLFSLESDFIANIFSLGKFKKAQQDVKEIQILERDSYSKLQPLEGTIRDYCEAQLKEFFEKNLYRKRAGNKQFEEALSEFAAMVEEVSTINLVTTRIPLAEYEDYLFRRTIDHNLRISIKNQNPSPVRAFARTISKSPTQVVKERIAPEKLFRTAKKINWEEINKKRKLTGAKGEEIVIAVEQEFFESIGRKDLADRVRHTSLEDGDGAGYDISSFFEDGREKYIEVKSSTSSLTSPISLSRNELGFLKEHSKDAFVYRVLVSGENSEIRAQPSFEFLETNDFIPTQYMSRAK